MKYPVWNLLKRLIPVLSVWFFAIYPILALYAPNADQLVIKQLLFPVILLLVSSTILYALAVLLFKNSFKAGIAVVILLILFWNYGLLYLGITRIINLKHWHLIPILVFIYCHFVFFISKFRDEKTVKNINTILLLPVSMLILYNLILMVPVEIKKIKSSQIKSGNVLQEHESKTTSQYPDIFLIILDEYAGLQTIKEEWGYDNSSFADFLRGKGFFVPEHSEARYNQTTWNISSLLNLNYITERIDKRTFLDFIYDPERIKGSDQFKTLVKYDFDWQLQKINTNFLSEYLKEHGYKIVALEGLSQHYAPFKLQNADITFSYQNVNKDDKYSFLINAFYMELIRKSMIFPFDIFYKIDQSCNINYAGTKYIFNYLKSDVNKIKGPKFIYAHIMCPHSPYVFDRLGNYVAPVGVDNQLEGRFVRADNTVNAAYLEQYIYVSNEIKKIANNLKNTDHTVNQVFIIQSDHGPRPSIVYLKDRTNSFKLFNAVYFPDGDYGKLYDSIAPVNTLRVVLNKYFGEKFEMLEDK